MNTNVVLVCMVGLPGCGKSTLANSLVQYYGRKNSKDFIPILISFDEIVRLTEQKSAIQAIHLQVEENAWSDHRKKFYNHLERVLKSIKTGVKLDEISDGLEHAGNVSEDCKYLIIVDDNMYYKSMRYKIFQLARSYRCSFMQLYIECDVAVAVARNVDRDSTSKIPATVIEIMNSRLEPPMPDQNPWESNSLIHRADGPFDIENIVQCITSSFHKGLSPPTDESSERAEARRICSQNFIHVCDKILREVVSGKILESKDKCDIVQTKEIAQKWNRAKKEVLSILKQGEGDFKEYSCLNLSKENMKSILEAELEKRVSSQLMEG